MSEPLYIVNIEGAIIREGRYLMILRGPEETYAAGDLSLVGGKVEGTDETTDILEETLRREIREEVGLEVTDLVYVCSSRFGMGESVVDIVFLCRSPVGEYVITDPGEVAAAAWMTAQEIYNHPLAQPWTHHYIEKAEKLRLQLNW
jgi:8-oxo-dGTP pyrophosphatase MutT (NUDIX family)